MTRSAHNAGFASDDDLDRLFELARAHPPQGNEWRALLRGLSPKRNWARALSWIGGAAAAGIGLMILLGWPKIPAAAAFPAIVRATQAAEVVKCTANYGTMWESYSETWASRGRFFARRINNGELVEFRDFQAAESAKYLSSRNAVLLSTYAVGEAERTQHGKQSVDDVIAYIESFGQDAANWTRRTYAENGRTRVEYSNPSSPRSYFTRFVADAATNRLVEAGEGRDVQRFEYPAVAPRDVYDLGVPRDARVIDGRAPRAVLELRERVMAAPMNRFGAYRATIVRSGSTGTVSRVITDGLKVRHDLFALGELNMAEEVCQGARRWLYDAPASPHRLHNTSVFDGETETIVGFDESGRPAYRRVQPRAFATYWASTLESEARVIPGGFIGCWGDTQIEALDADSNGWVGFRQLGQANEASRPYSYEKRYDPLHGFREVLAVHTNYPTAEWQLAANWADRYERSPASVSQAETNAPPIRYVGEVTQWAELRPGLWYPALRASRDLMQLADGSWTPRVIPNCENCRSLHYTAVAAEPLDSVDPATFVIPDDWTRAPLQN